MYLICLLSVIGQMSSKEVLRHFWILSNVMVYISDLFAICDWSNVLQRSLRHFWIPFKCNVICIWFVCYLWLVKCPPKKSWDISESLSNVMLYVSDLFVICNWSNVLQRSLRHFWIPFKCNVICIWFVCYLRLVKCPPKKSETFLNPFQM